MVDLIKIYQKLNALVSILSLIIGAWGIWQWYETQDLNEELQIKLEASEKREISFQTELSTAQDYVVKLKNQLAQAEKKIQDISERSQEHQAESREEFENTNLQIIELKKALNEAKNDLEKKDRILKETLQAQNWTLEDLNKKDHTLNEIQQNHERTLADLQKKDRILSDTNKKIVGVSAMLREVKKLALDYPSCEIISTKIIGIDREIQYTIANYLPLQPDAKILPPQPSSVTLPPPQLIMSR